MIVQKIGETIWTRKLGATEIPLEFFFFFLIYKINPKK